MTIITFNILKPLTLTALFIVFAAGFNTASAEVEITDLNDAKEQLIDQQANEQ